MIQKRTILKSIPHVLESVHIPGIGKRHTGKVRDFYIYNDKRILITTDRQSAFNYILGNIPYKGTVLNLLSKFWFEKTASIVSNHMIAVPDPNVMVTQNCKPIPVEMVVRGYMTGVTTTSIWYSYERGERTIYGIKFPDGLRKNQKLPQPVLTPTTHPDPESGSHDDERLTREEILKQNLVPKSIYLQMEKAALKLFKLGSRICEKNGLILVDTKYEFGLYKGKLMQIDEMHTPDSSRFWIKKTYKSRFNKGEEPENFDKEFLRLRYFNELNYRGEGKPPKIPQDLLVDLSKRYIAVYEKITGEKFKTYKYPINQRIVKNIDTYFNKTKQEKVLKYSDIEGFEKKDPFKKGFADLLTVSEKFVNDKSVKVVPESIGEPAALLDFKEYDFYLALKTDGVGTKSLIADTMAYTARKKGWNPSRTTKLYSGIGQDLIASNVNDLICLGATPIALTDEIAAGHYKRFTDENFIKGLYRGLKKGCIEAGITIPSGESPTMTDVIYPNTISITGSAIGIVRPRKSVILGNKLTHGDIIVGLSSSGVHTNGLSLVRKLVERLPDEYFTQFGSKTLGEEILTPTKIYVRPILEMLSKNIDIHYITHISGSSFRKVARAKQPFTYIIDKLPRKPRVLKYLQEIGNLPDYDAYETWNMGVGMVLFMPESEYKKAEKVAKKHGIGMLNMGRVEKGNKSVFIKPLGIEY